jgi:hypothetical protein
MASIIERAFELARSGKIPSVDELIRKLKRERYDLVEAHIAAGLRRELRTLYREAWQKAGNRSAGSAEG